jgi:hypothetical protein
MMGGMASETAVDPWDAELMGMKLLDRLQPLLARLHGDACQRDKAGNRTLFFDQLGALLLLHFFNPMVDSLRAVQRASDLPKVRKKLGCSRYSLGSLSEAMRVFDPHLLKEIVDRLGHDAPRVGFDPRLANVPRELKAVDGTLLCALPHLAAAAMLTKRNGKSGSFWRIHAQFDIGRNIPTKINVTGGKNAGEQSERAVLRQHLEPGRCYILDRGYAQWTLFNEIHAIDSNYVCRLRNDTKVRERKTLLLSHEAIAAGVINDAIVQLGTDGHKQTLADHPLRLITLRVEAHEKRSRRTGKTEIRDELFIVTDLLDVPAEMVALIYRYRWQIELFFRFFKQLLGCRHLLSQSENGIAIQTYCAIIACLLLSIYTGRKPTKATLEIVSWYLLGWATEADLEKHLAKLKKHDA